MNEEVLREYHRLREADAEIIATHMVDKLIHRLGDDKTVEHLTSVWARHLDQSIGKTVRRAVWLFFCTVGLVIAIKSDQIVSWLKG